MREGATFRYQKKINLSCKQCRIAMAESSLRHHMEISHKIFMQQIRGVDVGGGVPEIYVVSLLWVLKMVAYTVDR